MTPLTEHCWPEHRPAPQLLDGHPALGWGCLAGRLVSVQDAQHRSWTPHAGMQMAYLWTVSLYHQQHLLGMCKELEVAILGRSCLILRPWPRRKRQRGQCPGAFSTNSQTVGWDESWAPGGDRP